MASGIRIPAEQTDKFNKICNALDAAGIEHSVWNVEDMIEPSYDGPIDLDCLSTDRFNEFSTIVNSFIQ